MSARRKLVISPDAQAILGTFVDRQPWLYWDTVYAVGGERLPDYIRFLVSPMSSIDPVTGRVKSKHDTNMIAWQSFGATRSLITQRIGIYFPLWLSDLQINKILSNAYAEFRIAEKCFWEGRLDVFEDRATDIEVREQLSKLPDGTEIEESFDPAEFSGRMVQMKFREQYWKYIAPLVSFEYSLRFARPVTLDFEGIKPIMVPIIDGLCDRAVQ